MSRQKPNYETSIDINTDHILAHYYLGKLLVGGYQLDEDGSRVNKPDFKNAKILVVVWVWIQR